MSAWEFISEIARTILIMSVAGSVLALILFTIKPIVKNRIPKSVQYYLWVIVLAALLMPLSAFVSVPVSTPMEPVGEILAANVKSTAERRDELAKIRYRTSYAELDSMEQIDISYRDIGLVNGNFNDSLLGAVTMTGVIVFLMEIIQYLIFVMKLRRKRLSVRNIEIALLHQLCDGKRPPSIFRNPLAPTPMLIGIFRPVIYLPDAEYSEMQLRNILLHELTHLHRHDVIVKWIAALAVRVHWFNPIAYFVRREIDRACELACDEAIIKSLDISGKQEYGDTLIAVAAEKKMPKTVMSTTMCEEKKALKERLGAIMKSKKHTRLVIILSVVLIAAATVTVFVFGAGGSASSIFATKETTDRYGYKMGENRIDDVILPDEYEFTGRFTMDGDDLTSRLVSKVLFDYKGVEYYYYCNLMGLEYNNTTYPDIYNAQTNEKTATLWDKPQGMFQLDNYLYYAFGNERRVREINWHNPGFYYMWYKDFHYARLNLDTMENEDITRTQYEETWDYQEFRQWCSNVSGPITKLDVFVWRENDATLFNLKDGDNLKYKQDFYEYFIYHAKDAPTFSVYNAPNLISNGINEFNRTLAKYPNVEIITVYQMKAADFTEKEMAEIVGSITVPNERCLKTLMQWSDVADAEAPDSTKEGKNSPASLSTPMNAYKSVLVDNTEFYSTDAKKNIRLNQLTLTLTGEEDRIVSPLYFTVIDLDNDGTSEVVIWLKWGQDEYFAHEILSYRGGTVFGYTPTWRAFYELKTDGTYWFSSGALDNGFGVMTFTDDTFTTHPITYREWGEVFYVNNEKATEAEFQTAVRVEEEKPGVEWYDFTGDNVGKVLAFFDY